MTAIPAAYAWLNEEPAPRMLVEALALYGTVETPGHASSPIIMRWAEELGMGRIYTADATPWCGLFMALVAKRAGKPVPEKPLWALNWAKWGQDGGQPELGDVLVFVRPQGGHVALYVGEDNGHYHVLGGNQRDAVTITTIVKERMRACRQFYEVGKPRNIRPVVLTASGKPSENEA